MRCPNCDETLVAVETYHDSEFVCRTCGYYLPRGSD
ncbi:hypothetical protein BN996_03194 [Haloferax massiliensis]|uniref:TFIIB-type domain-containing protein n=1 Tax=Haloferax massiliensis TaxID=1476858 RepID=A0A0D6JVT3_9EURY|nr:hypothetical protein BN996_03194 [Haloferax massiliensis]